MTKLLGHHWPMRVIISLMIALIGAGGAMLGQWITTGGIAWSWWYLPLWPLAFAFWTWLHFRRRARRIRDQEERMRLDSVKMQNAQDLKRSGREIRERMR